MYIRKLSLENHNNDSIFLWGARQAGKTTLLEQIYPQVQNPVPLTSFNRSKLTIPCRSYDAVNMIFKQNVV
jgi:predicted AAA+ superfamily ATPase